MWFSIVYYMLINRDCCGVCRSCSSPAASLADLLQAVSINVTNTILTICDFLSSQLNYYFDWIINSLQIQYAMI